MKTWTPYSCSTALTLALGVVADDKQFDTDAYAWDDIIVRDVAVIGGGASGTFAAIKLKDMGVSVAVVEKAAEFGGHVNTYLDQASGKVINYGVQAYSNNSVALDFFARFNVPVISPFSLNSPVTVFADFRTGQPVPNFSSLGFDFSALIPQLDKYPNPQLGWNLPHPVPEDLLLPFRDFVVKYSLQSIAFTIAFASEGDGSVLDELTVYVFQRFNKIFIEELTTGTGFNTRNNSELYLKAQAELGQSALTSSLVVAAKRSAKGPVALVVQSPRGPKLVLAKQLLITMPLVINNLKPFDLDSRESGIFKQFKATSYYTYLITNTGLPAGYGYENAASNTLYNIPLLPTVYNIRPTKVAGIWYGWYGGPDPVPEARIKAEVIATVQRLSNSNTVPKFLAFASHTPFKQMVPAAAIRNGFYDDLNGLQGYRGTWYTGNAFDQSGTSSLWNFTLQLLPGIKAAAAQIEL